MLEFVGAVLIIAVAGAVIVWAYRSTRKRDVPESFTKPDYRGRTGDGGPKTPRT